MAESSVSEAWISRPRFEALVAEALDTIPAELGQYLENVTVMVEDEPDRETLVDLGLDPAVDSLYGLYHGTPLGERSALDGVTLPDRIVIYYRPLSEDFRDAYHLRREIRRTVVHEVGHFFGFDDQRLGEMGY